VQPATTNSPCVTPKTPLVRIWLAGSGTGGPIIGIAWSADTDSPRRRVAWTFRASFTLRSQHRGRTSNPLCATSLWTFKGSSNSGGLPDLRTRSRRRHRISKNLKRRINSLPRLPNQRKNPLGRLGELEISTDGVSAGPKLVPSSDRRMFKRDDCGRGKAALRDGPSPPASCQWSGPATIGCAGRAASLRNARRSKNCA
jgi:hypothetical protein